MGIMRVSEIAKKLRLTEDHIRKLCRQNKLPHARVGRSFRFDEETIDTWIVNQMDHNADIKNIPVELEE